MSGPVITTDRLVLRKPVMGDWEAFAAFRSGPRAEALGGAVSRADAWRTFCNRVGHWTLRGYGMFFFAPVGAKTAIGMAGPQLTEGWPEGEIAWAIFDGAAEGKGYAREAAAASRAWAAQELGWRRPVSYIAPGNTLSEALAMRLGAVIDPAAEEPSDGPWNVWRHPETGAAA